MGKKPRGKIAASAVVPLATSASVSLGKKAKAASLSAVLNLETILRDDMRWVLDGDIAATLASVEVAVKKVRQLQSSWPSAIPHRDASTFDAFSAWLTENGVDMSTAPFEIGRTASDEEAGDNATLFATCEIPKDETFVVVPPSVMISSKTAARSSIADFLAAVPALRGTPSMALSLHLLTEAFDEGSFFRPYIQVLPATFSIPFSSPFSTSDLMSMQPSLAFPRAVKTLRSQLTQYTKIYALLSKLQPGTSVLSAEMFSYSNFEWAVSVVMTRQNQLPSALPGHPPALALVPVWDMCNHAPGPHTTSVAIDPVTDTASVECAAMRTFEKGAAITIFYGKRPNIELLLYSGFVQPENEFDAVPITVSFKGEDRRENVTKVVLARRQLNECGLEASTGTDENGFMTLSGSVTGKDGGSVDDVLITTAKVKTMRLTEGESNHDSPDGAVQVLVDAINYSLTTYGTTPPREGKEATPAHALVSKLLAEEKRLLQSAVSKLKSEGLRTL